MPEELYLKEALYAFLAEDFYKQYVSLLNLHTRRILENKLLCQMFKGFFVPPAYYFYDRGDIDFVSVEKLKWTLVNWKLKNTSDFRYGVTKYSYSSTGDNEIQVYFGDTQ